MKIISIKIPEDLDVRLRAAAREARISRSKLIRDLLARSLHGKSGYDQHSAYDEMKDSLGVIRSGVTDLASNPEHLDGFGQ